MNILIVRNKYNSKAIEASLLLEVFLASQGVEYTTFDSDEMWFSEAIINPQEHSCIDRFDLAVVLGGDGTILRTASQIGYRRTPILGINFGNLGFMANSNEDGVVPIVSAALADEVGYEYRTNLEIDVYCDGAEQGSGDFDEDLLEVCSRSFFALNEMALARGEQGRVIDFSYALAGSKIADMRGDGLVVATATGSTAYALSAGGPLVAPGFGGLVIVPVAPHTLHSRAVVTEPSDVAEIVLNASSANRQATMFIDGERVTFDHPIRRVVVRTGDEPTILLRYKPETFYAHASEVFF